MSGKGQIPSNLSPSSALSLQPILHITVSGFLKRRINHAQPLHNTGPHRSLCAHRIFILSKISYLDLLTFLLSHPVLSCPAPKLHTPARPNSRSTCPRLNPSSALHLPRCSFSCLGNRHFYPSSCRSPGVSPVSSYPSVPTFNRLCLSWIISWTFSHQCPWHSCPFVLPFPLPCGLPPWRQPAAFLLTPSKAALGETVTASKMAPLRYESSTSRWPMVSSSVFLRAFREATLV